MLYLSDTRIHDSREFAGLKLSLGFKESVWSLGTPNVGGIAVLFFVLVIISDKYSDPLGRFTRVDYIWQEETFSSICVYAPANPTERKKFLSGVLMPYLQAHPPQDKCYIGGDFNFVDNPILDRSSTSQGGTAGSEEWTSITDLLQLKDLFRVFQPSKKSFTFRSCTHHMQTRIDRMYASKEAVPFSDSCTHVPLPRSLSDHQCAVHFTSRAITAATQGPSYWKLNVTLMKRPGFKKIVDAVISEFKTSRQLNRDRSAWWEMLKLTLQMRLNEYGKQQARRRKGTILNLESQLSQVNQRLASNPGEESLLGEKVRLDILLSEYYDDICEVAKIKAGLKYHVSGERPTKYFSALVKQRAEKSAITSLTCKRNGREVSLTDIEDILEEASNFYSTLYSKKLSENQANAGRKYLGKNLNKKLSQRARQFCERPLSVDELGSALKKLPGGKAPGIDGLPSEFFKMFWNDLKEDFLEVLKQSFEVGCLPYSMRLSISTLIFKKNSRTDIRNYRPISVTTLHRL
jgi:hypothetical protein